MNLLTSSKPSQIRKAYEKFTIHHDSRLGRARVIIGTALPEKRGRTNEHLESARKVPQLAAPTIDASTPTNWPQWTSSDPNEFINFLRSTGVPEAYIHDIVVCEINKRVSLTLTTYSHASSADSVVKDGAIQQLLSTRAVQLEPLLGPVFPDLDTAIGLPYRVEAGMNSHTNQQWVAVSEVLKTKETLQRQMRRNTLGFVTQEEQREIDSIEAETEAELERLLSPEDFAAYQVEKFKGTELGEFLAENLGCSSDELRAMASFLKAEKATESQPDREQLLEASYAELKSQVGETKYNELMGSRDPQYREAFAFVKRLGLDGSAALQIMALRRESLANLIEIRGQDPNSEQVRMAMAKREEYYRDRLAQIVGAEAAAIYARDAKLADWLQ